MAKLASSPPASATIAVVRASPAHSNAGFGKPQTVQCSFGLVHSAEQNNSKAHVLLWKASCGTGQAQYRARAGSSVPVLCSPMTTHCSVSVSASASLASCTTCGTCIHVVTAVHAGARLADVDWSASALPRSRTCMQTCGCSHHVRMQAPWQPCTAGGRTAAARQTAACAYSCSPHHPAALHALMLEGSVRPWACHITD